MPNVNGTSIELQIGASDTKVAKSVSCAITTASDLPDASTKDSSGFLENIYGLRNATIDADFLSTYDESITFETFATYQITREQIEFKYASDTIEISGNCKVESVEEVADVESVSRYSVVLSVDGILVQTDISNRRFLLLETGDFFLLETGSQLIINRLSDANSEKVRAPLNEGYGRPKYIGFKNGAFTFDGGTTWFDDPTIGKCVDFNTSRMGIYISPSSQYTLSMDVYVDSDQVNQYLVLRDTSQPILALSNSRSVWVVDDQSVNGGAFSDVYDWGLSFGNSLYNIGEWFNLSLTYNKSQNEFTLKINGVDTGVTINPSNVTDRADYIGIMGAGNYVSSFPKAFNGKLSNIIIDRLT